MPKNLDKKQREILKMSEIGIWLDDYDDIFSDFDPRPFSVRALSDDFLLAAKKGAKDKPSGSIELKLLVPAKKRRVKIEAVIKGRLLHHFKKHYNMLLKEKNRITRNGWLLAASGLLILAVTGFISTVEKPSPFFEILASVIAPAGWFATWFGLDKIFYEANQKKEDLDFYKKMSRVKISFVPY